MAETVGGIEILIRARTIGLDAAVGKATAEIEALKRAAGGAGNASGGLASQFKGVGAAIETHRAKLRGLTADLKQFERAQAQWGDKTAASWQEAKAAIVSSIGGERDAIRGLSRFGAELGQVSQRVRRLTAGDLKRAAAGIAELGQASVNAAPGLERAAASAERLYSAHARAAHGVAVSFAPRFRSAADIEKAAEAVKGLKAAESEAEGIGGRLAGALSQDIRHVVALFDESMRHQRGAMIASMGALMRQSGVFDDVVKGVGRTAVWFATTPMGQVSLAIAGIVATIGVGISHLVEMQREMRAVGGAALSMGENPKAAAAQFEALRGAIAGAGGGHAEALAKTLAFTPGLSAEERATLAGVAPAMLAGGLTPGAAGNLKAFERTLPRLFSSPAAMERVVEQNRLLGGAELAGFLGAPPETQRKLLAEALARRYGPYQKALSAAAKLTASEETGAALAGVPSMGIATLNAPALPPAPLHMPSAAEIGAIETIRKAFPKRRMIESLQNDIASIQAGLPAIADPTLHAEALAAIARDKAQIAKIEALPSYDSGGVVPFDQMAMVHSGELVVPAGRWGAGVSQPDANFMEGLQAKLDAAAAKQTTAAQALKSAGDKLTAATGGLIDFAGLFRSISGNIQTALDKLVFTAPYTKQQLYSTQSVGPNGLPVVTTQVLSQTPTILGQLGLAVEKDLFNAATGGIVKSLVGGMGSALFGGVLGVGKPGGFLGTGLFGQTAQAAAQTANTTALGVLTTALAANTVALGGETAAAAGSAAASTTSAVSTAGSVAGGIGGIGSFFKFVGGIFGFSAGGIVPAAAQGWSLPGFGSDTVPAMLTPGETVLPVGERPSAIAAHLGAMLEGSGGKTGDVHMHFHGPADGDSISRFIAGVVGDNPEPFLRAVRGAAFRFS